MNVAGNDLRRVKFESARSIATVARKCPRPARACRYRYQKDRMCS